MSAALIAFSQATQSTPPAGQAMSGVVGQLVTVANAANAGIVKWDFTVLDVPPGSSVPTGLVQTGATSTWTFTPDLPDSYSLKLVATDSLGNTYTDTRAFVVPRASGRYLPPFAGDSGSLNVGGSSQGWDPPLRAWMDNVDAQFFYVGKNAPAVPDSVVVDDVPFIAPLVAKLASTGGGTLSLTNVVLKSKLDLTPLRGTNSRIRLGGVLRYKINVGELEIPETCAIDGSLGGGTAVLGAGFLTLNPPSALLLGFNSAGTNGTREPAQLSTNSYVDSAFHYMYQMLTNDVMSPLSGSLMGATLTVSAVGTGDASFVGTYQVIGSRPYGTSIIIQMVWTGGTLPTGSSSNITWSIAGGPSGTHGQNSQTFGFQNNIPLLLVKQAVGVDVLNCWKQWASLVGCSNSYLGDKLHRVAGAPNTTSFYVVATAALAVGSLTLPDYGGGSNPGTANIVSYQATPVVRLSNYTSAKKLNIGYAVAPGFVMDAAASIVLQCTVEDCSALPSPAPNGSACVPFINDGVFWHYLRRFNCGNSNAVYGSVGRATLLFTCTNTMFGQYFGIGRIEDVIANGDGVVFRNEGTLFCSDMEFKNLVQEQGIAWPGKAAALFYFDPTGLYENFHFVDSFPADGGNYMCEAISVPGTNQKIRNIFIDAQGGAQIPLYGPNLMAANQDLVSINSGVSSVFGAKHSLLSDGYSDLVEIGRVDDFHPVLTLPYQIPLPPLLTVADWVALPGGTASGTSFSNNDSIGNPLVGPDWSVGKVIRVRTNFGAGIIAAQWTVATPAIGDVVVIHMRVRAADPAHSPASVALFTVLAGSITGGFLPAVPFQGIFGGVVANTPQKWVEVTFTATRISIGGGGADSMFLQISTNGSGLDLIVDPESISVAYIPNGTFTQQELFRLLRKVGAQVSGAPAGDAALPERVGRSVGPKARDGVYSLNTTSTSPQTIYTYQLPRSAAFVLEFEWVAVLVGTLSKTSTGVTKVRGYNNAGTVTIGTVVELDTDGNLGAAGAAAATVSFDVATADVLKVQVNAQAAGSTNWRGWVKQALVTG